MSTDSPVPQPRVLVLCFDGTSNQYEETNTNVVKFYALLDKRCPLEQVVYYQPGIGTFFKPGVVSPALTWLAKIADLAIAWYLDEHVMGGYKFLMQNYRAGDKICLFGFSRGAYTARALAGLLLKIGLLPRDNEEQIPFAYTIYKRTDKAGVELAAGFKRTFCAPVDIDFIGAWDTVASVGWIYGRDLPFTSANSAVRVFRHALSLDEHRARFQPNLYHHESLRNATEGEGESQPAGPVNATTALPDPETVERNSRTSQPFPAVQEVWFTGCHSDVGGGAVKDTVQYSLGEISLRWMVKQVILSQCGIRFDAEALGSAGIDVSTIVLPGATPREQNVRADIHDPLKSQPLWWLLEFKPMKFTWQEADGTWRSVWGINLFGGRKIRPERPNFHKTVGHRMGIEELKYRPRARWEAGTERYVE